MTPTIDIAALCKRLRADAAKDAFNHRGDSEDIQDDPRVSATTALEAQAAEIARLKTVLSLIKKYGELGCVDLGDSYPPGGKKAASKEVWQFPRHLLQDIDDALQLAATNGKEGL